MTHGTVVGLLLWLTLVLGGMATLWNFENTPGTPTHLPTTWPLETRLELHSKRPTLLTFLHPLCPCSTNTLEELEHIVARLQDTVSYIIVFSSPGEKNEEWHQSGLWRKAQSIPFAKTFVDRGGREAKLFHATTSGHTALYLPDGKLAFSGGITPSRGHSGDNVGRSTIIEIAEHRGSTTDHSFVFGCAIVSIPPK